LREHAAEFGSLGISIVIVTFEDDYFARQYVAETGLDWPLLIDEQRELYHYYGMLQASFWDLWGPRTWWVYLKELLKGQKLHRPTNDIHQRGGDILIDPDGTVRLHHVGRGPADRPSVEVILNSLFAAGEG
jgi:peroxiredoxin